MHTDTGYVNDFFENPRYFGLGPAFGSTLRNKPQQQHSTVFCNSFIHLEKIVCSTLTNTLLLVAMTADTRVFLHAKILVHASFNLFVTLLHWNYLLVKIYLYIQYKQFQFYIFNFELLLCLPKSYVIFRKIG